jgi:hypothetical protein
LAARRFSQFDFAIALRSSGVLVDQKDFALLDAFAFRSSVAGGCPIPIAQRFNDFFLCLSELAGSDSHA